MSLYEELERRQVFRVAALYAGVAWITLQAASMAGYPSAFTIARKASSLARRSGDRYAKLVPRSLISQ